MATIIYGAVFVLASLLLALTSGEVPTTFFLRGFNSSTWSDAAVPYVIDSKFESYEKKRIEDAMHTLNMQPICVQFRPKEEDDDNFLSFVRDDRRCQSQYIGFADVGAQDIYLAQNCSTARYIYWVLLQALGLPAEHMRPDRDEYITVKWENIDELQRFAFLKYTYIDNRIASLEYDYESRLHYSGDKFSKERGLKTIEAREDSSRTLGNPLSPTSLDYKKVAALYCPNGELTTPATGEVPLPTEPSDQATEANSEIMTPGLPMTPVKTPRPDALPAIPAALVALVTPAAISASISDHCQCLDQPTPEGSCDGVGAFQWKGMYQLCRSASASLPVCQCENVLKNPCWCEPSTGSTCQGPRCPLTTCVKKCRTHN